MKKDNENLVKVTTAFDVRIVGGNTVAQGGKVGGGTEHLSVGVLELRNRPGMKPSDQ